MDRYPSDSSGSPTIIDVGPAAVRAAG